MCALYPEDICTWYGYINGYLQAQAVENDMFWAMNAYKKSFDMPVDVDDWVAGRTESKQIELEDIRVPMALFVGM